MGMGKADNGRIAFMIPRAPVPFLRNAGRAELDISERHIGSDKYMAVPSGTDGYIHIRGKVIPVLRACASGHNACGSTEQ